MRLLRTTPKDRVFYNEHGKNLSAYYTIANTGQLLSAGSLALAVFTLLSDALAGRGLTLTNSAIAAVAVLIGLFVELANRKLARPSIRPLVVKDQFSEDEVKRHRHRLVTRFSRGGLLVVGCLSFVLSYMGSMDAGQLVTEDAPPPKLDSLKQAFTADTLALLAPYTIRTTAARQQFEATAANREKAAQDYASCARRGNKWCKKKQRAILAEIDAAKAEYSLTLATIATERGQALRTAITRRDADRQKETTAAANAAAELKATAAANGYIFALLTAAGQLVFYLMFYLILQIEAGSEIAEELEPNEFHYQPSVTSDFKAVLSHRVERGARRLMAKLFGDRDRLDSPLPYVSAWTPTAEPTNPEAPQGPPPAPGFYQRAHDPYAQTSRDTFNTPDTADTEAGTDTKNTLQDPEARKVYSRLMQYRRRLGEHTQKATAQLRKEGEVKPRTAAAIENNRQWVEHYTKQLKTLQA